MIVSDSLQFVQNSMIKILKSLISNKKDHKSSITYNISFWLRVTRFFVENWICNSSTNQTHALRHWTHLLFFSYKFLMNESIPMKAHTVSYFLRDQNNSKIFFERALLNSKKVTYVWFMCNKIIQDM